MNTRNDFTALLEQSGLSQRRLAALLGVAVTTVNRWSVDRGDAFEPPKYAMQFLRAFVMLSPEDRERLS